MWSVGNAGLASWFVQLLFFPPSFQFAYHLLHLPLLTPEGPRGDFDLNRKSGVVCLKISSSLHSAGKTLELRLDSETRFTWGSGSQEYWFDLKRPKVFIKSQRLAQRGSGSGWDSLDWLITQHTLKSRVTMAFLSTFKSISSDATD